MTINSDKTALAQREVDFVGYYVFAKGVTPLESHIEAIAAMEPPRDLAELRRFLGAGKFYRKFVRGFSKIAEPLVELLRKD